MQWTREQNSSSSWSLPPISPPPPWQDEPGENQSIPPTKAICQRWSHLFMETKELSISWSSSWCLLICFNNKTFFVLLTRKVLVQWKQLSKRSKGALAGREQDSLWLPRFTVLGFAVYTTRSMSTVQKHAYSMTMVWPACDQDISWHSHASDHYPQSTPNVRHNFTNIPC